MKVVAFVPIKLNNTRLPQKNTKPFTNGKPLCSYILSTLLTVPELDEIYVYCSNPEIKKYIPNGVKFFQRSTELDKDTTKINEVLKSFSDDVPADIYVLTHATAPFMSAKSISEGIHAITDKGYDSAFAAEKIQDFLWCDNKPMNYSLDNIPRTQDLPVIYKETCGYYAYTRELISKYNRRIGEKAYIVEVSEIEACDIDNAEDFEIADAICSHIISKQNKE